MSRAFIKEDIQIPEAEKLQEFRVYWGLARHKLEMDVVYSSDDLLDALQWAQMQKGYYQIRDSVGKMLVELDAR